MNSKKFVSIIMSILLLSSVAYAFVNRQYLHDLYIIKRTNIEAEAQTLQNQLDLTPNGNFLYEASIPEVQESGEFKRSCNDVKTEHSIVLGCYTKQRIYIFNVSDTRLDGIQQVTAAHELLHAVYERMTPAERKQINKELTSLAGTIKDERFQSTLDQYKRTEPGQINNELHSIIGTEISVTTPKLEEHYAKYFSNRQMIVDFAKQYERVFTDIEAEIQKHDKDLASMKIEIDALDKSITAQQSQIKLEAARLDLLRANDKIEEYNLGVVPFNELVRTYNANIESQRSKVAQYNTIVKERNSLATTQSDLTKQLDSNYQTL
jgi:hypothetical protein